MLENRFCDYPYHLVSDLSNNLLDESDNVEPIILRSLHIIINRENTYRKVMRKID